jgi:hypothetical protein
MKLWYIPDRWDWHGNGGYIVTAETADAARAKVEADVYASWLEARDSETDPRRAFNFEAYAGKPEWDEIEEVASGVYRLPGCDD